MSEDLKLLGEIGLNTTRLAEDTKTVNTLISQIDKQAKKLEDTMKNIDMNKFSKGVGPNTLYADMQKQVDKLTKDFQELNKKYVELQKSTVGAVGGFKQFNQNMEVSAQKAKEVTEATKKSAKAMAEMEKKFSSFKPGMQETEFAKKMREDYKAIDPKDISKKMAAYQELQKVYKQLTTRIEEYGKALDELRAKESMPGKLEENLTERYRKKLGEFKTKDAIKEFQQNTPSSEFLEKPLKHYNRVTLKYKDELKRNITAIYHESTEAAKQGKIELERVMVDFDPSKALKSNITQIEREKKKAEAEAKRIDKELKKDPTGTTDTNKGKALQNLAATATELYLMRRTLSYMNREISEYERKSIEVQRITGHTRREMEDLNKQTFEISKNTGQLVGQTQEVEALWARTGKTGKDLVEATKTTMMGFNVAEFKSAEDAVTSLNAIINQMYGGNAQKAPEILDALVKVADQTAVTNVSDLSDAVSRAGANAKMLGMDLHELNAVSSIAMQNMKISGDMLGTQFKTLFANMASGKVHEKLKQFGVELTKVNANGTKSLKSFEEMMEAIIAKYDEMMSKGDQAGAMNMVSAIGGKRFTPLLLNLMKDWDQFQERVDLSKNSKGFANKQNEKMMESYAKKVEQLKISFQELVVSVGNGGLLDGIKTMTDLLSGMASAAAKVPPQIKHIIFFIAALRTSVGVASRMSKIFGSSEDGAGGLLKTLLAVGDYAKTNTINGVFHAIMKTGVAVTELQGKEKALSETSQTTLGNMKSNFIALKAVIVDGAKAIGSWTMAIAAAHPVLAALAVATASFMAVSAYMNNRGKKSFERIQNGSEDDLKNIQSQRDHLQKMAENIQANKNVAESTKEFESVQRELNNALGLSTPLVKAQGESYKTYANILDNTIKIEERKLELDKQLSQQYAEKELARRAGTSYDLKSLFTGDTLGYSIAEISKIKMDLDRVGDDNTKLKTKLETSLLEAQSEAMKKLKELQDLAAASNQDLGKVLKETYTGEDYATIMDLLNSSLDKNADATSKAKAEQEQLQEQFEETAKAVDDGVKAIQNLNGVLDAFGSALDQYNEKGFIDDATVAALIDKDTEMAHYITKIADGKYALTKGFLDRQKEISQEMNLETDLLLENTKKQSDAMMQVTDEAMRQISSQDVKDSMQNAFSGFSDTVRNELEKIDSEFRNGQYGADEYFRKLQESISGVDFSKMDTSKIQELSNAIRMQLAFAIQDLQSKFSQGSISSKDFENSLKNVQEQALKLYAELNNLTFVDGNWVNQAGEIDSYANSLQQAIDKSPNLVRAQQLLKEAVDKGIVSFNELGEAVTNVPKDSEEWKTFADNFSDTMQSIKDTNGELWNSIVEDISESTGLAFEEAEKALLDTASVSADSQKVLGAGLVSMVTKLCQSVGMSAKQIDNILKNLGAVINSFDHYIQATYEPRGSTTIDVLGQKFTIPSFGLKFKGGGRQARMNGFTTTLANPPSLSDMFSASSARSMFNKKTGEQFSIESYSPAAKHENLIVAGMSSSDAFKKTFAGNKRLAGFMSAFDVIHNEAQDRPRKFATPTSVPDAQTAKYDRIMAKANEIINKHLGDTDSRLTPTGGKGKGGKGGKGKGGKGGAKDIPEAMQKILDKLQHKLDMGEIDAYEYAKEIEKLLNQYKGKLSEEGLRKIQKMIMSNKTGGFKEHMKASIDDLKDVVDVAQMAIDSIEQEKNLLKSLDMPAIRSVGMTEEQIKLLTVQIRASEEMVRKYKASLEAVNQEIAKLNPKQRGYKKTKEEMLKVEKEFQKELRQSENQLKSYSIAIINHMKAIQAAKQEQYDQAVGTLEKIQENLVTFINQRNQHIRDNAQKAFDEQMKLLQKEQDARDKAYNKNRERLQKELDDFRKYIQKKIEMLNRQWKDEDYHEELKKKQDERQEIQDKINVLSLDTSYAAKSKLIGLRKELADKNKEIADYQKQHERELTQQGLQDQLKDYEDMMNKKQKGLDDENKNIRDSYDDRMKKMQEAHEAEMKAMEERMKASAVYAEAKQAILSGYVQDVNGATISITSAIMQAYNEMGQGAGILGNKIRQEIQYTMSMLNNALQATGMIGGRGGGLQGKLGLTDQAYAQYIDDMSRKLGMDPSKDDVEKYILNKMSWGSASASERKRLEHENHLIRKGVVDRGGKNVDVNGLIVGLNQITPGGQYMRMGAPGGQFSPIPGMSSEMAKEYTGLRLQNDFSNGGSQSALNYFQKSNSWYGNAWPSGESMFGQVYKNHMNAVQSNSALRNTPMTREELAAGRAEANQALEYYRNLDKNGGSYGVSDDQASNRELFLSKAQAQNGMPYSQGSNRMTTHRDCSSYVYYATKNAGLYSGGDFYTGNMRSLLAKDGWRDLGQIPVKDIRRGDIFWRDGHTEIATQDGSLATTGAHRKGKPAGPSSWVKSYRILRHPKLNSFRDGGIIDYTGLANVHGSKANPEYVFNAPQFKALGKIVADAISIPAFYGRPVARSYEPQPYFNIDTLVNIEGNATKETAQEVRLASEDVLSKLIKTLNKQGVRR